MPRYFTINGRKTAHWNRVCTAIMGLFHEPCELKDVQGALDRGYRPCKRCRQRNGPATTELFY